MSIASAYNTNIFYGDVVLLVSSGTIERRAVTATMVMCGVFLGCSYTDATLGFVQRQHWPANQVATDAFAYVADDPAMLFKIQADETLGRTVIGNNAELIEAGAGSTVTGNSLMELDGSSVGTTSTDPLRIIDFLDGDEVDSDFPIMIVKINLTHQYDSTAGS